MSISVETLALAKKNTKQVVEEAVTSVYRYKGSVETFEDLPTSGQKVGDVYNVEKEAGRNYAWDGSDWDALGIAENLGDIEFTGADSEIKTINEDFWDKGKVQEELNDVSNDIANVSNDLSNTSNALNNSINEVSNVANSAYESASNANNSLEDLGNVEFSSPSFVTKDLVNDKTSTSGVPIRAREVKDGKITIKVTNNQDMPTVQHPGSFIGGYGPTPQQAIDGPGGSYTPRISSNVDEYVFTISDDVIQNDYYIFINNELRNMGSSTGFSFQGTLSYETEVAGTHTINQDYYDKDATNSLANDTLKAAKAYTDSKFDISMKKEVVQTLPVSNIDENTLYLVPKSNSTNGDIYDEYLYGSHEGKTDAVTVTSLPTTMINVSTYNKLYLNKGATTSFMSLSLVDRNGNILVQDIRNNLNNGQPIDISNYSEIKISGFPITNIDFSYQLSGLIYNWEKIGSTATDLSGYYTSNEVDNIVNNVNNDVSNASNQATCAEALARSASNEATAIRNNFSNIEFTGFKENIETISHNLTSNYIIVNQETGQKTTIGVPIENIAEEFDEENGNTQQRYMYLTYTCESEIFDNWEIGDYDQFDIVVGSSEKDVSVSYEVGSQDFYKVGEKQLRIPLVLYYALIEGYTYVGLPLQDYRQRDLFSDLTQVTWSYDYVYYGFSEEPVTLAQDYYTKGQMMTYVKDTQEIANKVYENKEQEIYQTISNTTNLAQAAYDTANAAAPAAWELVSTVTTNQETNSVTLPIDKEYDEYLITFNRPIVMDGPNPADSMTSNDGSLLLSIGGQAIIGSKLSIYNKMDGIYTVKRIIDNMYYGTGYHNGLMSNLKDYTENIVDINDASNGGVVLSTSASGSTANIASNITITLYGKGGTPQSENIEAK